jgi:hypothetical protein
MLFVPKRYKENTIRVNPQLGCGIEYLNRSGSCTSTLMLRIVGDDKNGSQCLGAYLGQPVPGRYKYGVLALQVVRVSNLDIKILSLVLVSINGLWICIWIYWQFPVRNYK